MEEKATNGSIARQEIDPDCCQEQARPVRVAFEETVRQAWSIKAGCAAADRGASFRNDVSDQHSGGMLPDHQYPERVAVAQTLVPADTELHPSDGTKVW